MKKTFVFIFFFVLFAVSHCLAQPLEEGKHHLVIEGDGVTCHLGVFCQQIPEGVDVQVAAIGFGKGGDFRNWQIDKVRLSINGKMIGPSEYEKFYRTKEDFIKYPAAILFAVIGTQYKSHYSGVAKWVDKVGMTGGLGLMTVTASGQLTGLRCVFELEGDLAAALDGNDDKIRVTLINTDNGKKVRLKTDIPLD